MADNGIGPPPGIDLENPQSFGLSLVQIYVQQMQGRLEVGRSGGTSFRVVFPME